MREDLSEALRTADPVAHEPGLSPTEVRIMRRAIVAAATDARRAGWSPGAVTLTLAVALTLTVAVFIGTLIGPAREESLGPTAIEQRQLQFETPGGTRVVWVLNSQFDLPKDRQP